jgi:hypothetical protein
MPQRVPLERVLSLIERVLSLSSLERFAEEHST